MLIGYVVTVLMGVGLGLTGGGGTILTVPLLVYFFDVNPVMAAVYSLFIVGTSSLAGAMGKIHQRLVSLGSIVYFGIPSLLIVFATRRWLVPAIPEVICQAGELVVTKALLTLLLFSIVMVFAARAMIRQRVELSAPAHRPVRPWGVIFRGGVTGMITGLVGAGGGFLIVPALTLTLQMPIKRAIGSSLVIIALNSLVGFMAVGLYPGFDWRLIVSLSLLAIGGTLAGNFLTKYIPPVAVKKAFGWLVLVIGIYIIFRELLFHSNA